MRYRRVWILSCCLTLASLAANNVSTTTSSDLLTSSINSTSSQDQTTSDTFTISTGENIENETVSIMNETTSYKTSSVPTMESTTTEKEDISYFSNDTPTSTDIQDTTTAIRVSTSTVVQSTLTSITTPTSTIVRGTSSITSTVSTDESTTEIGSSSIRVTNSHNPTSTTARYTLTTKDKALPQNQEEDEKLVVVVIISAVAGAVFIILVVFIVFLAVKKRKKRSEKQGYEMYADRVRAGMVLYNEIDLNRYSFDEPQDKRYTSRITTFIDDSKPRSTTVLRIKNSDRRSLDLSKFTPTDVGSKISHPEVEIFQRYSDPIAANKKGDAGNSTGLDEVEGVNGVHMRKDGSVSHNNANDNPGKVNRVSKYRSVINVGGDQN